MEEVKNIALRDGVAYIMDEDDFEYDERDPVCLTREDALELASNLAFIAPSLLTQDELRAATAIEYGMRALRPRRGRMSTLEIWSEIISSRYTSDRVKDYE